MALKVSQDLLNVFYPIGTVIIRNDTIDPKTLFGGTWVLCPDDYYLMSSTNDTPGSTFEGSTSTGSVALTNAQLPYISGWAGVHVAGDEARVTGPFSHRAFGSAMAEIQANSVAVQTTHWFEFGGNQGHAHSIARLQLPAINFRVWKRTA